MSEAPEKDAESEQQSQEPAAPRQNAADSATFARCATCGHAMEVDSSSGTLVCKKHNMIVNAEADEIPDDCIEYSSPSDKD